MRRIMVMVLCLVPALALGQAKATKKIDTTLWSAYRSSTLVAGGTLGGKKLPANAGFRVTGVGFSITVAAGTATGTTVFRLCTPGTNTNCSDGTNVCDVTWQCSGAGAIGGADTFSVSGSCTYPAGAKVIAYIQSQCTTAQPTVANVDVLGQFN